jgi:hypothetical protein
MLRNYSYFQLFVNIHILRISFETLDWYRMWWGVLRTTYDMMSRRIGEYYTT